MSDNQQRQLYRERYTSDTVCVYMFMMYDLFLLLCSFNQLCLPEYDTCEQFQSALMMAINEGAEGFGFL